jgi:hypothetical protein
MNSEFTLTQGVYSLNVGPNKKYLILPYRQLTEGKNGKVGKKDAQEWTLLLLHITIPPRF